MFNLKKDEIDKIIDRKVCEQVNYVLNNKKIKKQKKKNINLKPLLEINFTDDFEKLLEIFNDEDTVIAVISTLQNSSEEIQIVAKIALELHKKMDILEIDDYEN